MWASYMMTKGPKGLSFNNQNDRIEEISVPITDISNYVYPELEEIEMETFESKSNSEQKNKQNKQAKQNEQNNKYNVNISFQELLNKIGANARITSSYRPGAKTKQGKRSWHSVEGGAYDIVPNDGDFNRLRQVLTTHPLSIAWFKEHDKGILDETTKEMLARTGGTGAHFHIGPDQKAERFWKVVKAKSGIKIKKENRGKFTNYCGGKVTNKCIQKGKNSSNSTIRKRATFAANVRKWKHKEGGKLIKSFDIGGIFPIYSESDIMATQNPQAQQKVNPLLPIIKDNIKQTSDIYEIYQDSNNGAGPIIGDLIDLEIPKIPGPFQVAEGTGALANMYEKGITKENLFDLISGGMEIATATNPLLQVTTGLIVLVKDLSETLVDSVNQSNARKQWANDFIKAMNIKGAKLVKFDEKTRDYVIAYPSTENGTFTLNLIKGKGLSKKPSEKEVNDYNTYKSKLKRK